MKAYCAIIKARMAILLQYRAALFANLCTRFFWGMLYIAIFTAFFTHGQTNNSSLSLEQTISMIWLGQTLLQLLPWVIDPDIEHLIKSGNVAYELTRPIDLYWVWFIRSATYRIIPTVSLALPIFFVAWLCLGLQASSSPLAFLTFLLSLFFSVILSAAIGTLLIISLFWTICGEGIQKLMPHTFLLLSGAVVPLPLFPEWMQPFICLQPLRGILDIPSRIYTGIIPLNEIHLYLGFQVAWSLLLILLGRWLLKCAMKQFELQGG